MVSGEKVDEEKEGSKWNDEGEKMRMIQRKEQEEEEEEEKCEDKWKGMD